MTKFSPELWVARFIKSATNGKTVSIRVRRILTLIVIPIWLLGLIWSLLAFYIGCIETYQYFNLSPSDHFGNYVVIDEYMMRILAIPIYLLICFATPWAITRLTFWIVDADKVRE
jgi:hypothetical protein